MSVSPISHAQNFFKDDSFDQMLASFTATLESRTAASACSRLPKASIVETGRLQKMRSSISEPPRSLAQAFLLRTAAASTRLIDFSSRLPAAAPQRSSDSRSPDRTLLPGYQPDFPIFQLHISQEDRGTNLGGNRESFPSAKIHYLSDGIPSQDCFTYVACKSGTRGLHPSVRKPVATQLAEQNYFPTTDPQKGDIVVYFTADLTEATHIGIISRREEDGSLWVESKWGIGGPIVEHKQTVLCSAWEADKAQYYHTPSKSMPSAPLGRCDYLQHRELVLKRQYEESVLFHAHMGILDVKMPEGRSSSLSALYERPLKQWVPYVRDTIHYISSEAKHLGQCDSSTEKRIHAFSREKILPRLEVLERSIEKRLTTVAEEFSTERKIFQIFSDFLDGANEIMSHCRGD